MPRVTLLSDLDRAFHPHADPRNVAMIRRRHALWTELARLRGWDLAVCDVAALDAASLSVRGSLCWIDLPMLPHARYRLVVARAATAGAACVPQTLRTMARERDRCVADRLPQARS